MKRKRSPAPEPPVPESPSVPEVSSAPEAMTPNTIVEQARRAIEADRIKKPTQCVVCGGDCAPNSTEGLCWVCRRLKLSAWRDSDSQMSAQE